MSIEGKKREGNLGEQQPKYVGLTEGRIIAVNPTAEEFEEMMGYAPKEESKQFEYLGESKDGNIYLRVDFWLEETKKRRRKQRVEEETKDENGNKEKKVTWVEYGDPLYEKFKVTFFLENKERENKDFTKKQYINIMGSIGPHSWANDPNELYDWFRAKDYRVAYSGEENFYGFMRKWLRLFDFKNSSEFQFEWKKLMKGNVKEIRDQINNEYCDVVGVAAYIDTVEKDGEIKEYQKIYNEAFLYPDNLKFFRLIDYRDEEVIERLKAKKLREQKEHEKFVLNITDPTYGCKGFFKLKDLAEYVPEENIVASDKVISAESPDF
jgi:hypothetical protein